ncbi:ribonuclease H-like domain-containing protein [Schizophyllum fasciatum]
MPGTLRTDPLALSAPKPTSSTALQPAQGASNTPAYDPATDPQRNEGLWQRRMIFCETLETHFTPAELVQVCGVCGQYSARCCAHSYTGRACHHFRLVFTDGACVGNGQEGAVAGVGVVLGQIGPGIDQFSAPVTEEMDPGQRRTSQRAELLAALMGVQRALGGDVHDYPGYDAAAPKERIIATDSEYVVKGMTEWLPQWKRNGWRTALGGTPANLDLFQRLDRAIEEEEVLHNARFGFWHIPRSLNSEADRMAKAGARAALVTALQPAMTEANSQGAIERE